MKKNNINIIFNKKFDEFDSLYSILCAKNFINDSFICLYGDLIFDENLLSSFLESDETSIVVDYPAYKFDSHSIIHNDNLLKDIDIELENKNPSAQFIGISKFSKNSFKIFKETLEIFYQNNFFDGEYVRIIKSLLQKNMRINVFFTKGKIWININDKQKLDSAKKYFK